MNFKQLFAKNTPFSSLKSVCVENEEERMGTDSAEHSLSLLLKKLKMFLSPVITRKGRKKHEKKKVRFNLSIYIHISSKKKFYTARAIDPASILLRW